jgi:hypothetical protein
VVEEDFQMLLPVYKHYYLQKNTVQYFGPGSGFHWVPRFGSEIGIRIPIQEGEKGFQEEKNYLSFIEQSKRLETSPEACTPFRGQIRTYSIDL